MPWPVSAGEILPTVQILACWDVSRLCKDLQRVSYAEFDGEGKVFSRKVNLIFQSSIIQLEKCAFT